MHNSKKSGKLLKFIREGAELTTNQQKHAWIEHYLNLNHTMYSIQPNGTITLAKGIVLAVSDKNIGVLPIQLNDVYESFAITRSKLTSLKGLPRTIIGELELDNNLLETLEYFPEHVSRDISIRRNKLVDLTGIQQTINGSFNVYDNKLTTLKGGPRVVKGGMKVSCNNLTSFEGFPSFIGSDKLNIDENPELTSFKDIHKHIKSLHGHLVCNTHAIKDSILGLFLIDGFKGIINTNITGIGDWALIFNKHFIENGKQGVYDCQVELIERGLEEYAQL